MWGWVAVAWGAGSAEGNWVDRELMALDAAGRAASWHPNHLALELRLAGGQATLNFFDGEPRVCPYRATEKQVVVTCPDVVHTLRLDGDTLTMTLPWEEEGALVRSSRTAAEVFRDDARRRTLRLLPQVEGAWRRDGERRVFSASADLTGVTLAPCFRDAERTLCLHVGEQGFVLRGGQFVPADLRGADDGGEWEYIVAVEPGSAWVRDAPCTRGICALTRTDDDGATRWVPTSDRVVDAVASTSNLLGGRLTVERGPGVDRVEVRYRAQTRGAVYVDDVPIGWTGLGSMTDWQLLPTGPEVALPAAVTPAPFAPTGDERLAATARFLAGDRADDLFRSRAAAAVKRCASADSRPCVTGIGAVEIEVRGYTGTAEVDRVTLVLERGFGC